MDLGGKAAGEKCHRPDAGAMCRYLSMCPRVCRFPNREAVVAEVKKDHFHGGFDFGCLLLFAPMKEGRTVCSTFEVAS